MTARIAEWDAERGFGFLQVGSRRVFLHRRDFAEHHRRPAVGDVIRFTMGRDAKGRPCAVRAAQVNDGGRITMLNFFLLLGLLGLPVFALHRRGVDWWWAGGYGLVLGVVTYAAYALDKRRARERAWRLPEGRLQLLALLGGWPGAFLAQRRFRHKVSKGGFQVVFWLIVLGHQLMALDSLQEWKCLRAVGRLIRLTEFGTSLFTS